MYIKTVQRFLGLTSYFRRFIEGYAIAAKLLSDLLRKDVAFVFGNKQQASLQKLYILRGSLQNCYWLQHVRNDYKK